MLFFFRGRYALAARLVVGVVILVVGLVTGSRIGIALGALVLAWGIILGIGLLNRRRQAGSDQT